MKFRRRDLNNIIATYNNYYSLVFFIMIISIFFFNKYANLMCVYIYIYTHVYNTILYITRAP